MKLARLWKPLLALIICLVAKEGVAAQLCPAIPPRYPLPREARPIPTEIPDWKRQISLISKQIAARDLSRVRLVFIGDSITQGWEPATWDLFWSAYSPLNLGLSGDLTQGVLWRLHNGEWPSELRPDLAVILIGTNNASWHSRAEDTALGIAEIVRFVQARSPGTKVLLLGILPRGPDVHTPERSISQRVNKLIRQCVDNQTVYYLEPGNAMVDAAGRVSKNVLFDYLHPTMVGYAILGAGIYAEVQHLLDLGRH